MVRFILFWGLFALFSTSQTFGATFTECRQNTCAIITAPERVPPGEDFEIEVEGYIEDASSWDVSAYQFLENADWSYDAHQMVQTTSPAIDSKGFNWGGTFSKSYVLNRPAGSYTFTFVFGARSFGHDSFDVAVEAQVEVAVAQKLVPFDVKPQSCPNPLNSKRKGVLSAAIVGTADFDVTAVDAATITLAGVRPIHFSYEDVATPYEIFEGKALEMDCTDEGADGFMDLTLKFKAQEVFEALVQQSDRPLRRGETVVAELSAVLTDQGGGATTTLRGEDVICILKDD